LLAKQFLSYVIDRVNKPEMTLGNLVDVSPHHSLVTIENTGKPKISVIIPTRDKSRLLRNCLATVRSTTGTLDIELIIVDNDSKETETKELLIELESQGAVIIKYPGKFNYSTICNLAASKAKGEYLCFLNNDTEIITQGWLESMIEHASQPSVGLVGAVLLYPNKTLQHMGISLGVAGGIAGHPHRGESMQEFVPNHCFEVSAVTFACAVISKAKFDSLGGLDPKFPVGFNDVDISIRAINIGFRNILCTKSVLTHAESQSRPSGKSIKGFVTALSEVVTFLRTHPKSDSDRFFQRRTSLEKRVQ
jgi:GT2 family glycosyltransferase